MKKEERHSLYIYKYIFSSIVQLSIHLTKTGFMKVFHLILCGRDFFCSILTDILRVPWK